MFPFEIPTVYEKPDLLHDAPPDVPIAELWGLKLLTSGELWRKLPGRDLEMNPLFEAPVMKEFARCLNFHTLMAVNRGFLASGDVEALRVGEELLTEIRAGLPDLGDRGVLPTEDERKELLKEITNAIPASRPILNDCLALLDESVHLHDTLEDVFTCQLRMNDAEMRAMSDDFVSCFEKIRNSRRYVIAGCLANNLRHLSRFYDLSRLERRIFAFACLSKDHPFLRGVLGLAGERLKKGGTEEVVRILSLIFEVTTHRIRRVLGAAYPLHRNGLLDLIEYPAGGVSSFFDHFAVTLAPCFVEDPLELYRRNLWHDLHVFGTGFIPENDPSLTEADFAHVPEVSEILLPCMRASFKSRGGYANFFIMGERETGRHTLAAMLAERLGYAECTTVHECASLTPEDIRDWGRAHRVMVRNAKAMGFRLMVVSDADRLFHMYDDASDDDERNSSPSRLRADIEDLLRHPRMNTIWICSGSSFFGTAFSRYATVSVTMPPLPDEIRAQMVLRIFGDSLSGEAVALLVKKRMIRERTLRRVARLVSMSGFNSGNRVSGETLKRFLNSIAPLFTVDNLSGDEDDKVKEQAPGKNFYDPALVNSTFDPEKIIEGLRHSGHGTLCLYGPPGTGKSAYAAHLAEGLGRPLVRKLYSDLARWEVGKTEQNIAAAFDEAREKRAVLLIDEADSFLSDRTKHQYEWQNDSINEMLQQMEKFSGGYFIATTNLIDGLDTACIRRFDLKAKFDYLQPHQVRSLAERMLRLMDLEADEKIMKDLLAMRMLTPGDFAALKRQHEFFPVKSAADFLTRLQDDCRLKVRGGKSLHAGFL